MQVALLVGWKREGRPGKRQLGRVLENEPEAAHAAHPESQMRRAVCDSARLCLVHISGSSRLHPRHPIWACGEVIQDSQAGDPNGRPAEPIPSVVTTSV